MRQFFVFALTNYYRVQLCLALFITFSAALLLVALPQSHGSLLDTDGDGLLDIDEINTYGTDAVNPDTDGDGVNDGFELDNATDPLDPASKPPIVFSARTYGGTDYDYANSIRQTSDGGYIIAGSTKSYGAGDSDAWILKLNADGTTSWQNTYGGAGTENAFCIEQTSDGGYVVAGSTNSSGGGGHNAWILKLNSDGSIAWQKTYGGVYPDFVRSVQQTVDGGYIVSGLTQSFGEGNYDAWILKLNADGTVAWQKAYGGTGSDRAMEIQQTIDGGYIVTGDTQNTSNNYVYDAWILKLNIDGTTAWQKRYGRNLNDHARSVQQTSDGGYIVTGYAYIDSTAGSDVFVIKLNPDGTIAWQKRYGGNGSFGKTGHDYVSSIRQTSDGGYVVAGNTQSYGAGNANAWILKLNTDGTIAWQKVYGGASYDTANSIQQTSDGGYVIAGNTQSYGMGRFDAWVLKLNIYGDIESSCDFISASNAAPLNTSYGGGADTLLTLAGTSVSGTDSSLSFNIGSLVENIHCGNDEDGDGIIDSLDLYPGDNDNDGVLDGADVCPGFDDNVDTDGDGVPDGCDLCQGSDDNVDADGDGVPDGCDNCPNDSNAGQADIDGDVVGDDCDVCPDFDDNADADSDGVSDGCDVCPGFDDNADADSDGVPDGCDACPGFDDNLDADSDGMPDDCDPDDDNDGVLDGVDVCPGFDDNVDTDSDGLADGCDPDDDNDGILDETSSIAFGSYTPSTGVSESAMEEASGTGLFASNMYSWSIDNNGTNGLHISGSDLGISADSYSNIDAQAVLPDGSVLFSTDRGATGVDGSALEYARETGLRTSNIYRSTGNGTNELYMSGAELGIEAFYQSNIDALALLPDGSVLFSTYRGSTGVGGSALEDARETGLRTSNIYRSTGNGTNELYMSGADLGIEAFVQSNIDALSVLPDGSILFCTEFGSDGVAGSALAISYDGGEGDGYAASNIYRSTGNGTNELYISGADLGIETDSTVDALALVVQTDNCPLVSNPGQEDLDEDGVGDVCDNDRDGDGLSNAVETNTGIFVDNNDTGTNPDNSDTDGDGFSDGYEIYVGTDPLDDLSKPDIDSHWIKTYGGILGNNIINSVQQTSDGGFVGAGYTRSQGAIEDEAWIIKFNKDGSVAWQKTYGGSSWDVLNSIRQTSDGGYVAAGYTYSSGAGSADGLVVKLNTDGSVAWQKTYGDAGYDEFNSIRQISDGGYIVTGRSGSNDAWIMKLAVDGSIAWQKKFGDTSNDKFYSVQQTSDGGFVAAGYTRLSGPGAATDEGWIVKLNGDGSVAWQKTYGNAGGTSTDKFHSIQQTSDGGYIAAGYARISAAVREEGWIVKLNGDGSVAWQKAYGGSLEDYFHSIRQTSDGGYIAAGYTYSSGAGKADGWIVKLNGDGSVAWQNTYGKSSWDWLYSVWQTSDGGYIAAGETESGYNQSLVIKLDANGDVGGSCSLADTSNVIPTDTSVTDVDISYIPVDSLVSGVVSALDENSSSFSDITQCTNDADGDGFPDIDDRCPGFNDILDADGDGVPDGCDVCPGSDDNVDTDTDGIPDGCDPDDDNDGVIDGSDNCPGVGNPGQEDNDVDGIGDACDSDDDNDGALDTVDAFPFDPSETTDSDGDGVGDNADACPGFDDNVHSDADAIADGCDNCPNDANAGQENNDGDSEGDVCDLDDDDDGTPDTSDAFPFDPSETTDSDGDGVGDNADACPGFDDNVHSDADAIADGCDNCPNDANAGQENNDGDSEGDVCDLDDDNDGTPDTSDAFPFDPSETTDSDGDGVGDNADACPGFDDNVHSDADAIADGCDNCPNDANAGQENNDGDSEGDVCDLDDDNDGTPDTSDAFPFDPLETTDSDGDGVGDNADTCPGFDDSADEDSDGVPDGCDAFPADETESSDNDGDGTGDNSDEDFTPVGEDVIVEPVDTNPDATIQTPVTLVFEDVEEAGTTTVTSEEIVFFPPSSGFAVDSIMSYELESTVEFTGSVEVCFTYGPGDRSSPDDPAEQLYKLFHFEDGQWVDVTTSLDTPGDQICGMVTSFSPFAIFVEDIAAPEVTAELVPVPNTLKKKKGCYTVTLSATDDNDDDPELAALLNGYPVTNGQIVELKHSKKFKVKVKGEGSSDDDGSGKGRRCNPDVKFKGPDFTLEVTATDYSGNTGTAEPVYFAFPSKHDGHSHDHDSASGHKKHHGSDDDSGSGPRKKKIKKSNI